MIFLEHFVLGLYYTSNKAITFIHNHSDSTKFGYSQFVFVNVKRGDMIADKHSLLVLRSKMQKYLLL